MAYRSCVPPSSLTATSGTDANFERPRFTLLGRSFPASETPGYSQFRKN